MKDVLSRRALIVMAMVLPAWTAWPGLVRAAPISFKVPLSGGQEVPPVFPAGAGIAELTYDPSTRVVTWSVAYSDLSGPPTMAHFHGPAQPGKNAPVLVWLIKQGSPMESPINGQATLTRDRWKRSGSCIGSNPDPSCPSRIHQERTPSLARTTSMVVGASLPCTSRPRPASGLSNPKSIDGAKIALSN
jgi:hypothetical protein